MRVEWCRANGWMILSDSGVVVQKNVRVDCEETNISHDDDYKERFRAFLENEMIIED